MIRSYLIILSLFYFQAKSQINNENVKFSGPTAYDKKSNKPYTGDYTEYYPGDVKIRGNYVNGLKEGVFEYYSNEKYPNIHNVSVRRLDSSVTFHLGKRNGIKKTYDRYAILEMLQSSESFVNNQLHGMSIFWENSGLLMYTRLYERGKLIKQTDYPIDSSITFLDYVIREYPNDTIHSNKFRPNDSLLIEVVGIKMTDASKTQIESEPLTQKGFKVKSFKIIRIDSEETFHSEKFALSSLRGWYNDDKLYISQTTIIDPYGFEYKLPDKKIIIAEQSK